MPVQAYYFSPTSPHVHPTNGLCTSSSVCIFSRTLPDVAFASAYSLLVLFYAQLAGTASGGGPRGLSLILTRKGLFETCNVVFYAVYLVLFLFTGPIKLIPYPVFQMVIWSMLAVAYLLLLATLSFFGPVLVNLLKPSLKSRSALAVRLVSMCVLCFLVFLARSVTFSLAVWKTDAKYTNGVVSNLVVKGDTYDSDFNRNVLGYTLAELLPTVAVLIIMHQSRKKGGWGWQRRGRRGHVPRRRIRQC